MFSCVSHPMHYELYSGTTATDILSAYRASRHLRARVACRSDTASLR